MNSEPFFSYEFTAEVVEAHQLCSGLPVLSSAAPPPAPGLSLGTLKPPQNARLQIASELNHFLSDAAAFLFPDLPLPAIVREDERPLTIKGVGHYFCGTEG